MLLREWMGRRRAMSRQELAAAFVGADVPGSEKAQLVAGVECLIIGEGLVAQEKVLSESADGEKRAYHAGELAMALKLLARVEKKGL